MSLILNNFGHNRPMPSLVLVHGLKESGKSTLAEYFCKNHGYKRVKMAAPLKNMIRSLMSDAGIEPDLIERYIEGDLKEVPIAEMSGRTSRHLMQTLGDQWRKMQAEDFWIEIAVSKIEQLFSKDEKIIIDDIRYHNEFGRFKPYKPLSFVVTRGQRHFEPVEKDRHPGEIPMPVGMFDYHIANDFTIEDYWATAERCFDEWARCLNTQVA